MSLRYTLTIALLSVIPALAQPDASTDVPARPDHAERSRPSAQKKYRKKQTPPYLMQSSTGIPVTRPLFLNRAATQEGSTERAQNESSIAINPLRPNVLFSSAVDYRSGAWAYVSTDGGRSWRNVSLGNVRSGWPSGNDPSVAFDHLGHGYVMYGAIVNESPQPWRNGQSGIYISKSTDDGETWMKHIPVIEHRDTMTADSAIEDKYYIEIDRSTASPYLGWMYTPWKRVIDADSSTQIMFSRSTNGGLDWSPPIPVSPRKNGTSLDTTFGQSFPISAAGPDGTVYVAWHDGPIRSIGFARSTDGGATFTPPRLIVTGNPTHGTALKSGDNIYHVLKGTFRAETYPTLAADNSESPRRGWLYLAYAAGVNPNIYFTRSTDMGETWSTPKIIQSDTTNDQWWPWLAVDPMSGEIAVMYSDSRHDPENIYNDQYVSLSSDGGDTWIDRRVTDVMSDYRKNPFNGIFSGDYSGIAFRNGMVYPSFLDTRDTTIEDDNDVYVSIVNTRQPYPVDSLRAIIDPVALTSLELRWELPVQTTTIFGHPITGYTILVRRDGATIGELPAGTTSLAQSGLEHGRVYGYAVSVVAATDPSDPAITDTSIARVLDVRAGGALEPMAPVLLGARESLDTIDLTIRTPSFRADGSVPLTNLDAITVYRDGRPIKEVAVFTTDTARVISIRDVPFDRGYYRYHVTALDKADPQHESASSDTIVVYAGPYTQFIESFEGPDPRFLPSGTWGTTKAIALSGETSLTDSPDDDYPSRRDTWVQVYPVIPSPVLTTFVSFAHIAIVDPTDTAFVEVRFDHDTTWTALRSYDWTSYPAWSDSSADPGDWQREFLPIAGGTSEDTTVTVRFRLKTSTFRHGDGWYLDDVAIESEGGTESEEGIVMTTGARPNPFVDAVVLEFTLVRPTEVTVRVVDLLGREIRTVDLGMREPGRHGYTLDGAELAPGTYLFEITTGAGRASGYVVRAP